MNKVITRTCIVTRKALSREEMFRVVKTPNHEIKIDSTCKAQGRGCYISKDKDIILLAKKKALIEKHLKVSDCTAIYDELLKQF
jgi:predicted RNA-binding protein YlxR (DUF448 family)